MRTSPQPLTFLPNSAVQRDGDGFALPCLEEYLCKPLQFFRWTEHLSVLLAHIHLSRLGSVCRAGVGQGEDHLLLQAVSAVNPNIVAVMSAGSAVEMPWLDQCRAVIHGYLCGQAGAGAMLQSPLPERG